MTQKLQELINTRRKAAQMHPNPIFHDADAARNLGFARDRAFGVLSVNGAEGPLVSHVPFIVSEVGDVVDLHLVRSNPIVRALSTPAAACLAVTGADSYVSPDWYGVPDQVPTWNYVAVHLRGVVETRLAEELLDTLDRQAAVYEARLAPKASWTSDKMTRDALEKMLRMIVPCRMQVRQVDGTWKLSQNKPAKVRMAAADHMEAYGFGAEPAVVAALMRGIVG